MRLAVWSPLPPSPSGIADYVAEQLPALARHVDVTCVVEDPAEVDPGVADTCSVVSAASPPSCDLDVYHLGNSPSHAYVYRAACARPGVAVLHEWSLHHMLLGETVERGDPASYLREMRRCYGETGSFVGRQVAIGLGGDVLPSLFPLCERPIESSLAVVGLTRFVCSRTATRLRGRPVLHLPHHVSLPLEPLPSRAAARAALNLPKDAIIVTAPGLATSLKSLDVAVRTLGRLRERYATLHFVVAGDLEPQLRLADWAEAAGLGSAIQMTGRLPLADLVRHIVAADVVLCLRFPTHGEISGVLLRTLGVGRPALVTAGTPATDEFPEGVVVPVDPSTGEEAELLALLDRLLSDAQLRGAMGELAREHVRAEHDLEAGVTRLCTFLADVATRRDELLSYVEVRGTGEGSIAAYLRDEVRFAAIELGLPELPPEVEKVLVDLFPPRDDS